MLLRMMNVCLLAWCGMRHTTAGTSHAKKDKNNHREAINSNHPHETTMIPNLII
jgi:hypothetical protein